MSPNVELHELALSDEARARDPWQQPERVIEWLRLRGDETVVDLGAGTGYFSYHLARALPRGQVIAVEPDPDLRRVIAARARRLQLPIRVEAQAPSSAALVFACNLLRHLDLYQGPDADQWVVIDFDPERAPEHTEVPPRALLRSIAQVEAQLPGHRRVITRALPRQYYLELTRHP